MFTETLSKNTKNALALLGKSHLLDEVALGGGTACALQLGHRISIDLDFFTTKKFEPRVMAESLNKVGKFELGQESWGTVSGVFQGTKFAIFVYNYPVLFSCKLMSGVNVLDLRDIAAMKLDAIATRGTKRDFVDLYFICKSGIPLEEIFSFYDKKYGNLAANVIHIQKSLAYFVDAETEQMPNMLKKTEWEDIKKFFEEEVRRTLK